MKKIGFLILIISTIVLITFSLNKTYKDEQDYLSKNHSIINLEDSDNFSGLDILKKDLKGKKIVLTGENHYLDKNHLIDIKMLKYLQKQIGVNYYLGEEGYSISYFVNKYLETGDESYLNKVFKNFEGTRANNIGYYEKYRQIYEFNKTLPENERIKIIGVDIEPGANMSYDYIMEVMKDKSLITNDLEQLLYELQELTYRDKEELTRTRNIAQKVLRDAENNESVYKNIFKEGLYGFKHVVKNISNMCEAYLGGRNNWNNIRDTFIYENFKSLDSRLEDPIYFGQWGGSHIYQDIFYSEINSVDEEYVAYKINKDEKYKGKILSINYGYYNKGRDNDSYNGLYADNNLFKDYLDTEDDMILFKLNSKNSPFKEQDIKLYLNDYQDFKGKPITNFFEYVLLIKNSAQSKQMD